MIELTKAFRKTVEKYPHYAINRSLPSRDPYQSLNLKIKILLAYQIDMPEKFAEKLARTLSENKDLFEDIASMQFNEINRAALTNQLWDELDDEIELLFSGYLEMRLDLEDEKSRARRVEKIPAMNCSSYGEEKRLDNIYRARDMNATMKQSIR